MAGIRIETAATMFTTPDRIAGGSTLTTSSRRRLLPAARCSWTANQRTAPLRTNPPESTSNAAIERTAGLLKPASASCVSTWPNTTSATSTRMATTSGRIRFSASKATAASRIVTVDATP
jgi:hypothetical protein